MKEITEEKMERFNELSRGFQESFTEVQIENDKSLACLIHIIQQLQMINNLLFRLIPKDYFYEQVNVNEHLFKEERNE